MEAVQTRNPASAAAYKRATQPEGLREGPGSAQEIPPQAARRLARVLPHSRDLSSSHGTQARVLLSKQPQQLASLSSSLLLFAVLSSRYQWVFLRFTNKFVDQLSNSSKKIKKKFPHKHYIAHKHQLQSWLLCFQSGSLIMCPGKQQESAWAPATHVGDLDAIPSSRLPPGQAG